MKIFERFNKFLGIVKAKETGNEVRIVGIDGLIMKKHFKVIFETDALSRIMFTAVTDTSITLNGFFVPDFVFMLKKLRVSNELGWAGRRTVDKILHEIMTNTWYKMTTQDHPSIIDKSSLKKLKWSPMPHQLEFLDTFGDRLPRYNLRGILLGSAAGTGKAQPLDSMILTDCGWITMGNVTLETMVALPDGGYAKVQGIYPQGKKDIYRITLQDGRKTECCEEHLWKVYDELGNWEIMSLKDIMLSGQILYVPIADRALPNVPPQRIKSIVYIGKKKAQCIAIDHPDHLYITDDYIVTHNTFIDFLVATCIIPPEVAEVKIIISPKKAIHLVWEKTVKDVFYKTPTYWVSDSGIKMPLDKCEYYIFNFEQLDKAIELGKALIARKARYFVIIDESHNFADFRSGRTQKLVQLLTMRDDIYSIWASGSPILKLGSELISFLKCSDPRFDRDAESRFKRIYSASPGRANEIFNHRLGLMMGVIIPRSVVTDKKSTVRELPVKLPKNLANRFLMTTVREDMKEFIIERLKFYETQVKDYRKFVNTTLDYHEHKLTTRMERRRFDEYRKNLKVIMRNPDLMLPEVASAARHYEQSVLLPSLPPTQRKPFKSALSAVKNIKLKVRGEALGTVLSKRRSECAAALALYCKPENIIKESVAKTLFFASSVLPVTVLSKHLTDLGFESALVCAETNMNLTTTMERFDVDPNLNPICATMQSLSEAVPVTAASTIVLLNRPYRQGTWDQLEARCLRIPYRYPVTVIEVTLDTDGEPNVSSTTDAILANVRQLINELVGDGFSGPNPDEREYQEAIDASAQDVAIAFDDEKNGLM